MTTHQIIKHLKEGESYSSPYEFVVNIDCNDQFHHCKEFLLVSFKDNEGYFSFNYCGYIRVDVWDVFVKIWEELGMSPIKFSNFIPSILGAGHKYNVVRFTRTQPLFKKIIIFDIFIELLSVIHSEKITTADEFLKYSPDIYSILFQNKNLWRLITKDTLSNEYYSYSTRDYSCVGAIYNADKIKKIFEKKNSNQKKKCVVLKN